MNFSKITANDIQRQLITCTTSKQTEFEVTVLYLEGINSTNDLMKPKAFVNQDFYELQVFIFVYSQLDDKQATNNICMLTSSS